MNLPTGALELEVRVPDGRRVEHAFVVPDPGDGEVPAVRVTLPRR